MLRGEAGVGKTALLEYVTGQADDCRVLSVTGVESEMELAFAALHQMCAPILDQVEALPGLQREALGITFGLQEGSAPDRFVVGLAVLTLLAEAGVKRPLVCLVDDQQWVDLASSQVLAFVARRLGMESVGIVFSARVPTDDLTGLPQLPIKGLHGADARSLLDTVLAGPVDARVRDEIVAETNGNPLALLELARSLTRGELAGGFGLPGALTYPDRVEETFQRRVEALPEDTRRLLVLAAAEPLGEPLLVWQAADELGIDRTAANPAVDADLAEFGARVRFRHPLVRSTIYYSASARERQEVHGALAKASDEVLDPDRRAWHRAQSTPGPDDDVAAELERSAERAQARGGLAAAAAFLERAVALTLDPTARTSRALAAAEAKIHAGDLDAGLDLLAVAEGGPIGELEHARAELIRAQLAYVMRAGLGRADAVSLLFVNAAKRLQPVAPDLAWATYAEAFLAAAVEGRFAAPGGSMLDVALAVSEASEHTPTASDALVDGFAANFVRGYATSVPIMRDALRAFDADMPVDERLRGWPLIFAASTLLWDDDACVVLTERWVKFCRDAGALSQLSFALVCRSHMLLLEGDIAAAASAVEEARTAVEATGIAVHPGVAMYLAAFRGHEAEASSLVELNTRDAFQGGSGSRLAAAQWASAVLNNGLGRYPDALVAARRAIESPWEMVCSYWSLPELVEAAVRSGAGGDASDAYRRIVEIADATGTDWALGVKGRSRALLTEGDGAEEFYQESVERLGRTRMRSEHARAHLVYGEWLRRQRRRGDARQELRTALEMFEAMGMDGFAERTRRELRATGERARKRSVETHTDLTAQEAQVAKLARDGLSNVEIGARLFISSRTVQYHLSKVFTKLDITSRAQLERVLQ